MVKPQTARRRQRAQQHTQSHTQHAQHQDEIGGMHDEADIMSFRSAATQRFVLNQELIENLTEKWISVDNIAKPKPFANVHPEKAELGDAKDTLYFGNYALMKQKLEMVQKKFDELKQSTSEADSKFQHSNFLEEKIDIMAQSYENRKPVNTDEIADEFTQKMNKQVVMEHYTLRQLPHLRNDVSEAPADYWEELKLARQREAEAAAAAAAQNTLKADSDVLMNGIYQIPVDGTTGTDQIPGFDSAAFDNGGLDNMMDDVNFGLQSTLDDQDFLSQIDHSME